MSHDHHTHHGHDHDAPSALAPGHAAPARAVSLLRTSAAMRLLGAAAFIACVWLAVLGAMA